MPQVSTTLKQNTIEHQCVSLQLDGITVMLNNDEKLLPRKHPGLYIALSSGIYNIHLLARVIQEDDLLRYHGRLTLQAQISWVFPVVPLRMFARATISEKPLVFVMISWQEHSYKHSGEGSTVHISLTAVRTAV